MNIFVTGTGTGIGKTIVSAILTEALKADYWKPVQAGNIDETDSDWVRSVVTNQQSQVHSEAYLLNMPASPHIAARKESVNISIDRIIKTLPHAENLVIEGAGGIMVPLNESEFVIDLIKAIDAKVVLVSRNGLGSINHSLLTAMVCRQHNIKVLGWMFNDQYLDYEKEIIQWTGYHHLGTIPFVDYPDKNFIAAQAIIMEQQFYHWPW